MASMNNATATPITCSRLERSQENNRTVAHEASNTIQEKNTASMHVWFQ